MTIYPPPNDPMAVARELLPLWQLDDGRPTLRHWRGTWMRWTGAHWAEVEDREIRAQSYRRLEDALYLKGEDLERWSPTKRKISDLLDALAAIIHLPASKNPPTWVGAARDREHGAGSIVACANGLLHVPTRELLDHDPSFFNLASVPFGYDPGAPEPKRWLEFLTQLWPDKPDSNGALQESDSIKALQEFAGYIVSGRTDLQKIMLIVGPTRSGKGTIARVLTALIGKANVAGPTLAGLCTNFGLSPLIGKPLAVVSDARLSGASSTTVVERLLTISGEDTIDIDRKYREPWTGRLPTRFLILSNELPAFGDSSGVIANRFIVLSMERSWLGKEDPSLTGKLTEELPGILNWSLEGLARLEQQGHFTEPTSSAEAVTIMRDTASPMSAFVREVCKTGADCQVKVSTLFDAWRAWCVDNGRPPGAAQIFARNLRSVLPQVRVSQPREEDGSRDRVYLGITLRDSEK